MSKIVPVMMPQMGESLTEGTLVRWLKQVGDAVSQDEPLFEISTDKVDTDVPSPVAGRLTEQIVREGQTVSVGVPVALVSTAATDAGDSRRGQPAGNPAKAHDEPSGHFKSSHAAQLVSFGRGRADQRATQPASRAIDTTSSTAAPPGPRRPAAEVKAHGTSPSPGPWSPATLDAARRGGLSLDVLTPSRVRVVADALPSATSNAFCRASGPPDRPLPGHRAHSGLPIRRPRVCGTTQPSTIESNRCRLFAAGLPTI